MVLSARAAYIMTPVSLKSSHQQHGLLHMQKLLYLHPKLINAPHKRLLSIANLLNRTQELHLLEVQLADHLHMQPSHMFSHLQHQQWLQKIHRISLSLRLSIQLMQYLQRRL